MKGSKIEVADDPELRRVKRIGSVVSQIEYKGQKADVRRPSLPPSGKFCYCLLHVIVVICLFRIVEVKKKL